jgi:type III secretion protein V
MKAKRSVPGMPALPTLPASWIQFLVLVSKQGEISAAVLILVIVLMMILPLPTLLVDLLIAINISASLLLIVLSLHLPGPEDFTSFPSVLLLSTLFRLGIEISTSRLILLQGDAGHIVETFGEFVVGGNLVVGLIIFLIIAVVQFLVITKGAERVAEVSARFMLDAIPGKQMAIDSDLRAGLINLQDVKRIRAEMDSETRMHGAMDGAMKFVKGDAIAGLIIVMVNLLGGVTVGVVQHGMGIGDALNRYSVLTIGDGLIAQVPSLLISITAGMMITRAKNQVGSSLSVGGVIAKEMLAQPKAWVIAACGVLVFGLLPGMPWPVFLVLAGLLATVGVRRISAARKKETERKSALSWKASAKKDVPDEHDVAEFFPARPLVLQIAEQGNDPQILDRFIRMARRTRNRLVVAYGLTIPFLQIENRSDLNGDAFILSFREVEIWRGQFRFEQFCVFAELPILSAAGIIGEPCVDRSLDRSAFWVTQPEAGKLSLPAVQQLSALAYFDRFFERLLFQHTGQFVNMTTTQALLQWLESDSPTVAKELAQALSTPRFTEVIRSLCSERVAVRNIRQIAEALVMWAPKEKDLQTLAEYVRIALGAQICQEFAHEEMLYTILLERELEELMRAALRQTAQGYYLELPPEITQELIRQIREQLRALPMGHPRPVLLTTQDLRCVLRKLIVDELFDVHVLSFSELTARQQVHPVGHLVLEEAQELSTTDVG